MNLDSVPPVRPLLTHVIPVEPVQREAGINICTLFIDPHGVAQVTASRYVL